MKASLGRVCITPADFLPLGGNIRADSLARGTHDDLYCDIFMLSQHERTVCFLDFDLLGLMLEDCHAIKARVAQETGIAESHIVITVSHTHSGPDTAVIFKEKLDPRVKAYIGEISRRIAEEALRMQSRFFEAKLACGVSEVHGLSFNRRLVMAQGGPVRMNWEGVDPSAVTRTTGPIDPALSVLAIYDKTDSLRGVMVNFTLHPAVLVGRDWLYSKDYIHDLECGIREELGQDIAVFFANGAEGNINHIDYQNPDQPRGFDETRRIGRALAGAAVQAVRTARRLPGDVLRCASLHAPLPVRRISDEAALWAKTLLDERGDEIPSLLDGVPDEIYAREILALRPLSDGEVITEFQAVRIDDVLIATFPGEVFVEFGLAVKERSGYAHTLVFGLSNDLVGYVPNAAAFSEGGYEIKTARSSKLAPHAGDEIVRHALALADQLR